MDYVNDFFKFIRNENKNMFVVPHIITKYGTTLSVQASSGHYCFPRTNNVDKYTEVEVFCFNEDLLIFAKDYHTSDDDPLAYVPVEIINEYIGVHGGIDYDKYKTTLDTY